MTFVLSYRGHNLASSSNIGRTLAVNTIVDHSDVVGASPVGFAAITSSFSTWHLTPVSKENGKTRR